MSVTMITILMSQYSRYPLEPGLVRLGIIYYFVKEYHIKYICQVNLFICRNLKNILALLWI